MTRQYKAKKDVNRNDYVTIEKIAKNICPNWSMEDWFRWPPDVFALITIVLTRTGAYKICLSDHGDNAPWNKIDWQKEVEADADKWIRYATQVLSAKDTKKVSPSWYSKCKIIRYYYNVLKEYWGVI